MKTTIISLALGVSLTFGAALTSRAESPESIRLSQGRGQSTVIQLAKPTSVALFVKSETATVAKPQAAAPSKLHPVTVTSARGSSVTLFERVK